MDWRICVLLSSIFVINGQYHAKQCLFYNKKCVTHCSRNMHPYHTRCDRNTYSQRTCDNPEIYSLGYTCGWSRCDCNGDLLLDETSGFCVDMKTCERTFKGKNRNRRRNKTFRKSRKLKLNEDQELIDQI
ncbi:uncharacterized protein ACR2FA_005150 [Aphomia sociella]